MHRIAIDPEIAARARARRGGQHAFASLLPQRTAFVAVDAQNWTMDPASPTYISGAEGLTANLNLVAGALRAAGGHVVWVQMAATEEEQAKWAVFYDGLVRGARDTFVSAMLPGSHWHALYPELDVRDEDILSRKTRYSCFIESSSDLHAVLAALSVDTVIVAGFATNVCCESTARDAMMLGYRVIVLADGCGCRSDAEHNASLSAMLNMFADIRTCAEVAAMLRTPGSAS